MDCVKSMMFCLEIVIACLLLPSVNCEVKRRLVLHSSDDIAREFQMLRQEIEALKMNQTQEIQSLKSTEAQEIQSLKSTQAQEIQSLKSTQAQEIQALKSTQVQEIQALKSTQAQQIQTLNITQAKEVRAQAQELSSVQTELSLLKNGQGSTYVRWGRTTCNGNGTEKVYSGFTAGTPYDVEGGAASYICLPQHPTWGKYKDGIQNLGCKISGTEYQTYSSILQPFPQNMVDQDAPCVVCRSPRPTTIMIPGRTTCYSSWTMEYTGYLMTGHYGHKGGSDYACVDADPEAVYHGEADMDGKLLYMTEVKCGSLPCQEYPDGRELACVVCTK